MRIGIVSDGLAPNTKVVNAETGEEIENVTEITWRVRVGEIATAEIIVDFAEIDAVGETTEPEGDEDETDRKG